MRVARARRSDARASTSSSRARWTRSGKRRLAGRIESVAKREQSEVRITMAARAALVCAALGPCASAHAQVDTVPGMPPVPDPKNLYSETTAGKLSTAVAGHKELVYVPHVQSNNVYVIDPETFTVVDKFKVGLNPQHVVPSWDLQTLWVTNNPERTTKGSLTPIDPATAKPDVPIADDDPYNMYFSPARKSAIA